MTNLITSPETPSPASCRSALFVDFDNVYIGLNRQEPELARRFASQPGRWVEWLQRELIVPAGSWLAPTRRILVRRCYLNPQSFSNWRAYFIRNGFETIDCPPLTAHGKTSADVHMVLDIVDFLSGSTQFDEFIIMSADADFTPVLLKLRKHDRRSIVLAIGPSSSAYAAASDLVIDQDDFREFLLAGEQPPQPLLRPREPAGATTAPPPTPAVSPHDAFLARREEISRAVREMVTRSNTPVSLSALAQGIRSRYPELTDWGGCGSFSGMLSELDLSNLTRTNTGPGYLYDPGRHAPPEVPKPPAEGEEAEQEAAEPAAPEVVKVDPLDAESPPLRELARRVSDLTDTPYMPPATYAEVFSILASEINTNGFHMNRVSKAVRDECVKRGLAVARQPVNFILQGIAFSGHRFGKAPEIDKELARAFFRNALNLCARNQVYLTKDEEQILSRWLVGENPATTLEENGTNGAEPPTASEEVPRDDAPLS